MRVVFVVELSFVAANKPECVSNKWAVEFASSDCSMERRTTGISIASGSFNLSDSGRAVTTVSNIANTMGIVVGRTVGWPSTLIDCETIDTGLVTAKARTCECLREKFLFATGT